MFFLWPVFFLFCFSLLCLPKEWKKIINVGIFHVYLFFIIIYSSITHFNSSRVGGKDTRVKLEPQDLPLEEVEVGSLVGMEQLPIKEEKFEEVKEEMMEDQVTAAAIETSSELTAALESIG